MTENLKKREAREAAERLREMLSPGDTVYTTVTHVSPSGMTRWIRVFVMRDNAPVDVSWLAARVLGWRVNTRNHGGVETGGAGMDMGFHLVYSLSRVLFRDRFGCIMSDDVQCPANDHVNARDWGRMEGQHSDSGYALNQRWL